MVTYRQVRRLMMELGAGTPLSTAATRVWKSENTTRRYRKDPFPSQRTGHRAHRTHRTPLRPIWPEIEAL